MKTLVIASLGMIGLIVGLSIAVAGGMFRSAVPATDDLSSGSLATAPPIATAEPAATADEAAEPRRAMTAWEQASEADKYLFAMIWDVENEQTAAMRQVVSAAAEASEQADSVFVQVTDPAEREFVRKFRLTHASMPLILVIAPNGAVTGGLSYPCEAQDLLDAFTSPAMAATLLPLQKGKVVLLCVQNDSTDLNDQALQGVHDFAHDPSFADLAEVVMVDPRDSAEASFLSDLRIDPQTSVALTVLLVPPASVAAVFEGETTRDLLLSTLRSCGPGGCAPR